MGNGYSFDDRNLKNNLYGRQCYNPSRLFPSPSVFVCNHLCIYNHIYGFSLR